MSDLRLVKRYKKWKWAICQFLANFSFWPLILATGREINSDSEVNFIASSSWNSFYPRWLIVNTINAYIIFCRCFRFVKICPCFLLSQCIRSGETAHTAYLITNENRFFYLWFVEPMQISSCIRTWSEHTQTHNNNNNNNNDDDKRTYVCSPLHCQCIQTT